MPDEKTTKERQDREQKEREARERTTPKPPQENPPPEEGEEGQEGAESTEPEPPKPANYQPIKPEDTEENPVEVEVPKTDEEVAEEGTALAKAESAQTGGVVPFLSSEPAKNKRIWAMDAAHNTNDRAGGRGAEHPDLVETAQ